jgi:hypothetical protein
MTEQTGVKDPWLTLREVAAREGCCYMTVWRAVQRGDLKAKRRGPNSHWKVRASVADAWGHSEEEDET